MYHPYFRGKLFELITIRETADLLAASRFTPIIEPVKEALSGLERTLKAICDAEGAAIVIINPDYGDHADDGNSITSLLKSDYLKNKNISAGILLKVGMNVKEVISFYEQHHNHNPVFIHSGFTDPKALSEALAKELPKTKHIFIERYCETLYRKHFKGSNRVLIRDGFERKRNADYTETAEKFSELHVTYSDEGMNGFGDFLIVGDDYTEGGGPAYAVAIHLTFIDSDKDDVMYIYHFVSTTNDTPTDPAGKFGQALNKLIHKLNSGNSKIFESESIKEFRDLHTKQHFPGLGYVKKLSMKHHIETIADYFKQ